MKHTSKSIYRLIRFKQYKGHHPQPLCIEQAQQHSCTNCGTSYQGHYCPNCGQRASIGRLSILSAFENMLGIFTSMERGFLHTCTELIYRPGHMIRDYINGHRIEYIRPIQLLFFLTSIYILLHYLLFSNTGEIQMTNDIDGIQLTGTALKIADIAKKILSNLAIISLLTMTFYVLPIKVSYRKTDIGKHLNTTEYFFAMSYCTCQQMLFSIILLPFAYMTNNNVTMNVSISFVLITWNMRQLHLTSWLRSIKLTLIATVLFIISITVASIAVIVPLTKLFNIYNS